MKSKNAEKFTDYYRQRRVTGTYDAQREGNKYRKIKRAVELKYFLELIDKQNEDRVLELGCSSGFLTKHLGKVTAIDTSEGMLEITKKKNPLATCVAGDMFSMPFKEGRFNKVVTMRVWNHLDESDLKRAIRESKRVLKNNGYLIFDAEEKSFLRRFIGFFYQRIFRTTGYKIYQYSLKDLKRILGSEGFKIEKVKIINHRIGRQILMRNKLVEK
ncbi:MAG: class I SAM-dependent methyltransferase [Candidatus Pacearchaeota archaeon]|nr:class I SAM-dependent methyltransferase [Candidatus Pacearchaeota archaeon]